MMKIVLARSWMIQQAGRRITEYLFGVILGERKVPDPQIPVVRLGLDRYHSFESWWYGAEKDNTILRAKLSCLKDLLIEVLRGR